MNGPGGKYEHLCTAAREAMEADGCVLIVLGGKLGNGFAVEGSADVLRQLPKILRELADKVDKDLETATFNTTVTTPA